jgi:hypothetical protein
MIYSSFDTSFVLVQLCLMLASVMTRNVMLRNGIAPGKLMMLAILGG